MRAPDASVALVDGPWRHRMVAANGARFHVAELGEGPLILLLHGFPQFWWAWRHQLVTLADAGYRAVAMDLRGYGASDKTPRGYDPFTLSADVTGVIRSLGEPEATLVGHGWGGFLAWTTAALHPGLVRGLGVVSMAHPRRLRRALLTDPRQVAASRYVVGFQAPIVPERRLTVADGALVERLLRAWAGPGWPDHAVAARYREAARIPGVAHSAMEYHRWAVRSVPRSDGRRFARRISVPVRVATLHLHGVRDGALRPATAYGSGRYVDAPYRWRLLPGVGHFPHEEDPATFDATLLTWLADPR
jgi:pimeloyl-ACP methyl ester carboxylesterase